MRYINKIATLLKLSASAPDLESEIYKNTGDFKSAVRLWSDHFASDLSRIVKSFDSLPVSAKVVSLEATRLRKEYGETLAAIERFAYRVDMVLSRRCLQYTELVNRYLRPMDLNARKSIEKDALEYLSILDSVMDTISGRKWIAVGKQYNLVSLEPNLFSYLENLSQLDRPMLIAMLKKGEVPFRIS